MENETLPVSLFLYLMLNPCIEGKDTSNEWFLTNDANLYYNHNIHGNDYAIKTLDAVKKYEYN